ncbi:YraN family protein [Sphingobacterium suaedae]|uniref:YraN family protein n=1 Tax=Sphingobacterium suaedae TaxID=1686402 RepID=A0ABW5KI13_9SPHI
MDLFGAPEPFVDRRKQQRLIRAADEYLALTGDEVEIRFIIIGLSVCGCKNRMDKRRFFGVT